MSADDIPTPTPEQFAAMGLYGTRNGIAVNATPILVELYLYGMHHGLEQAAEQMGHSYEEAHAEAVRAVKEFAARDLPGITEHVRSFVQSSAETFAAKASKAGQN